MSHDNQGSCRCTPLGTVKGVCTTQWYKVVTEPVVWLEIGREILERQGWSCDTLDTNSFSHTRSEEGPSGGHGGAFRSVGKIKGEFQISDQRLRAWGRRENGREAMEGRQVSSSTTQPLPLCSLTSDSSTRWTHSLLTNPRDSDGALMVRSCVLVIDCMIALLI